MINPVQAQLNPALTCKPASLRAMLTARRRVVSPGDEVVRKEAGEGARAGPIVIFWPRAWSCPGGRVLAPREASVAVAVIAILEGRRQMVTVRSVSKGGTQLLEGGRLEKWHAVGTHARPRSAAQPRA